MRPVQQLPQSGYRDVVAPTRPSDLTNRVPQPVGVVADADLVAYARLMDAVLRAVEGK